MRLGESLEAVAAITPEGFADGTNRHWLIRTKKHQRRRVLHRLGPRDAIVEMTVSSAARRKQPGLPKVWVARAITYQRKGFRAQTLLTSLLDFKAYPADEIATLYHERWELELGYDEIKTELLDREEAIRSKSPTAVTQELWGIFLACNLVRLEMQRVARRSWRGTDEDQLCCGASADLRRVALVRHRNPRCHPQAPEKSPSCVDDPHLAAATLPAQLPRGREDQEEQVRAEAAEGSK